MDSLYLYNQEFSLSGKIKELVKRAAKRGGRGPAAVFESLTKGLDELKVGYKINQRSQTEVEGACVVSGVKTLGWAIAQKQHGKIKKIIAGPNLVISPDDSDKILRNPLIDAIVVPSEWVKDFYLSVAPELKGKIYLWAAGVDVPAESGSSKDLDFLVFAKKVNQTSHEIIQYLKEQNYKFNVFTYGKFAQGDYFESLEGAKNLIYIAESESQGLAMFEAWARNVPTLVWERGFWQADSGNWQGLTASPYLSSEAGLRFKDFEDFKNVLLKFLAGGFKPREYVEQNFTHKLSAQKYFEIVQTVCQKSL